MSTWRKRFFFILGIWLLLHALFRSRPLVEPHLIAHRGAAGLAPENTLVGIQTALDVEAAYIEVDVQRSADGVLYLLHDQTVNRTTTGRGRLSDLTAAEIDQLDAGSRFSAAFAGEPIPTLAQALALIQKSQSKLVIELKDPKLYPGIEQEVAQVIRASGLEDQVLVMSFDHAAAQTLFPLVPQAETGAVSVYPFNVPEVDAMGVFWPAVILDPTLVWRLHRRGIQVWVWTVNYPPLMRLLYWLGVDGITTDQPDQCRMNNE